MDATDRTPVRAGGIARSAMRLLLMGAAAGALLGWQVARTVKARARRRNLQHDLHRWEGEGGQVLD